MCVCVRVILCFNVCHYHGIFLLCQILFGWFQMLCITIFPDFQIVVFICVCVSCFFRTKMEIIYNIRLGALCECVPYACLRACACVLCASIASNSQLCDLRCKSFFASPVFGCCCSLCMWLDFMWILISRWCCCRVDLFFVFLFLFV